MQTIHKRGAPDIFSLPNFAKAPKQAKLMNIVFGADLRRGHPGLSEQARKLGINLQTLNPGEFVAFVNNKKSGIKFFAGGTNMLGYFKMPGSQQFNVKVLRVLPRYFSGGQLHYQAALEEIIRNEVRVH